MCWELLGNIGYWVMSKADLPVMEALSPPTLWERQPCSRWSPWISKLFFRTNLRTLRLARIDVTRSGHCWGKESSPWMGQLGNIRVQSCVQALHETRLQRLRCMNGIYSISSGWSPVMGRQLIYKICFLVWYVFLLFFSFSFPFLFLKK